jgi:hypothetical protein
MGRKRRAEERRRHAEENGFNDDDTDVDDNPMILSQGMSWITPRKDTMCKWSCGLSKLPFQPLGPDWN